jgi:GNAT superfamily N-acetyltransferase
VSPCGPKIGISLLAVAALRRHEPAVPEARRFAAGGWPLDARAVRVAGAPTAPSRFVRQRKRNTRPHRARKWCLTKTARSTGGFAMSTALRIAPATESDVPIILSFIRKLAEYEKLSHLVVATEESIREHVFGANPVAEVLLADWNEEAVGFALYFRNFSTFLGQAGIYLEDLFVEPAHRGKGIGKALLSLLAKIALERGYGRLEWTVLDWNTPSTKFYRSLGAIPLDEWTAYRLTGDALHRLAAK